MTGTGNYQSSVQSQTTVYYQPGDAGSAHLLASQFSRISRVVEATVSGPPLVVVLGSDWTR